MRKAVYAALMGLALLLAACGGQTGPGGGGNNGGGGGGGGGGSGGGDNTVTVRLMDPQNAFQKAYYRVGNGSWTQLTFTNGQATFQASGSYEMAARCRTGVHFYKAARERLPALRIVCSQEDTPGSVSATLNVSLPAQIGGVSVRDGDVLFVVGASSQPSINGGRATVSISLPPGRQTVGLAVLRMVSVGTAFDVTPIGGKLVELDIQEGQTYSVDATGWQAFSARNISPVIPPAGYNGGLGVVFVKNDMKGLLPVGMVNRYGVFSSGTGGKYLGFAGYSLMAGRRSLAVFKDTGGGDWNVNLPAPWATGQLRVNGTTFTLTYPNAQVFRLTVGGLLKDGTDNTPLSVTITLLSEGSSTTYTLPDLGAQLGYQVDSRGERSLEATAFVRGLDTSLNNPNLFDLFGSGSVPPEDQLNGVDVAVATAQDSYTGDNYTLP